MKLQWFTIDNMWLFKRHKKCNHKNHILYEASNKLPIKMIYCKDCDSKLMGNYIEHYGYFKNTIDNVFEFKIDWEEPGLDKIEQDYKNSEEYMKKVRVQKFNRLTK